MPYARVSFIRGTTAVIQNLQQGNSSGSVLQKRNSLGRQQIINHRKGDCGGVNIQQNHLYRSNFQQADCISGVNLKDGVSSGENLQGGVSLGAVSVPMLSSGGELASRLSNHTVPVQQSHLFGVNAQQAGFNSGVSLLAGVSPGTTQQNPLIGANVQLAGHSSGAMIHQGGYGADVNPERNYISCANVHLSSHSSSVNFQRSDSSRIKPRQSQGCSAYPVSNYSTCLNLSQGSDSGLYTHQGQSLGMNLPQGDNSVIYHQQGHSLGTNTLQVSNSSGHRQQGNSLLASLPQGDYSCAYTPPGHTLDLPQGNISGVYVPQGLGTSRSQHDNPSDYIQWKNYEYFSHMHSLDKALPQAGNSSSNPPQRRRLGSSLQQDENSSIYFPQGHTLGPNTSKDNISSVYVPQGFARSRLQDGKSNDYIPQEHSLGANIPQSNISISSVYVPLALGSARPQDGNFTEYIPHGHTLGPNNLQSNIFSAYFPQGLDKNQSQDVHFSVNIPQEPTLSKNIPRVCNHNEYFTHVNSLDTDHTTLPHSGNSSSYYPQRRSLRSSLQQDENSIVHLSQGHSLGVNVSQDNVTRVNVPQGLGTSRRQDGNSSVGHPQKHSLVTSLSRGDYSSDHLPLGHGLGTCLPQGSNHSEYFQQGHSLGTALNSCTRLLQGANSTVYLPHEFDLDKNLPQGGTSSVYLTQKINVGTAFPVSGNTSVPVPHSLGIALTLDGSSSVNVSQGYSLVTRLQQGDNFSRCLPQENYRGANNLQECNTTENIEPGPSLNSLVRKVYISGANIIPTDCCSFINTHCNISGSNIQSCFKKGTHIPPIFSSATNPLLQIVITNAHHHQGGIPVALISQGYSSGNYPYNCDPANTQNVQSRGAQFLPYQTMNVEQDSTVNNFQECPSNTISSNAPSTFLTLAQSSGTNIQRANFPGVTNDNLEQSNCAVIANPRNIFQSSQQLPYHSSLEHVQHENSAINSFLPSSSGGIFVPCSHIQQSTPISVHQNIQQGSSSMADLLHSHTSSSGGLQQPYDKSRANYQQSNCINIPHKQVQNQFICLPFVINPGANIPQGSGVNNQQTYISPQNLPLSHSPVDSFQQNFRVPEYLTRANSMGDNPQQVHIQGSGVNNHPTFISPQNRPPSHSPVDSFQPNMTVGTHLSRAVSVRDNPQQVHNQGTQFQPDQNQCVYQPLFNLSETTIPQNNNESKLQQASNKQQPSNLQQEYYSSENPQQGHISGTNVQQQQAHQGVNIPVSQQSSRSNLTPSNNTREQFRQGYNPFLAPFVPLEQRLIAGTRLQQNRSTSKNPQQGNSQPDNSSERNIQESIVVTEWSQRCQGSEQHCFAPQRIDVIAIRCYERV